MGKIPIQTCIKSRLCNKTYRKYEEVTKKGSNFSLGQMIHLILAEDLLEKTLDEVIALLLQIRARQTRVRKCNVKKVNLLRRKQFKKKCLIYPLVHDIYAFELEFFNHSMTYMISEVYVNRNVHCSCCNHEAQKNVGVK